MNKLRFKKKEEKLRIFSRKIRNADYTGGPCNSRIFGGIEDPRVTKPRLTSNVLVLKS